MTSRPDIITLSLGPDHEATRAALRDLATAVGLDGNVSALMRLLAETHGAAHEETALLLEAARDRATGGDEWSTLAIVRDLLPPIALTID